MKILTIGDVVGMNGCKFLRAHLPSLKKIKSIDIVIANGENSADGNGITPVSAEHLFKSGVDVITTGNHAFRRKEVYSLYDDNPYLIRPANFYENVTPGRGVCVLDMGKFKITVINLIGLVYMESLNCPFRTVDKILDENKSNITIVDFHAEATAEKKCMGFYLDGRVSAIFGTHTHVQTADEVILPNGTGYITDIGMTGAMDSVLGVKANLAIDRMKNKLPVRFETSKGATKMDCAIFDIDEKTGKTTSIERLGIS